MKVYSPKRIIYRGTMYAPHKVFECRDEDMERLLEHGVTKVEETPVMAVGSFVVGEAPKEETKKPPTKKKSTKKK